MKNQITKPILLLVLIILFISSCKEETKNLVTPKDSEGLEIPTIPNRTLNPSKPTEIRKVQFSLYTDKDFSNYDGNITFSFFIRNLKTRAKWDTVLAQMRVKDIPALSEKIFIEKAIPNDDKSLMSVGILYHLENVGISWKSDTLNGMTKLKKLDLNFQ